MLRAAISVAARHLEEIDMAAKKKEAATQPDVAVAEVVEPDLTEIAVKTMAGDARDFLLDRLKHDHSPLPWHLRGEEEQKRYIEAAELAGQRLVRTIAHLIATQNRPAIGATIKKAALKDHIAIELHIGLTHPLRHELLDSVGANVVVVLTKEEEFVGERSKPKINRDQAEIFGPDDDPPPADDSQD